MVKRLGLNIILWSWKVKLKIFYITHCKITKVRKNIEVCSFISLFGVSRFPSFMRLCIYVQCLGDRKDIGNV